MSLQVIAIIWSSMIKNNSTRLIGQRPLIHVNIGESISRFGHVMRSSSKSWSTFLNKSILFSAKTPSWLTSFLDSPRRIGAVSTICVFGRWIIVVIFLGNEAVWLRCAYASYQMLANTISRPQFVMSFSIRYSVRAHRSRFKDRIWMLNRCRFKFELWIFDSLISTYLLILFDQVWT